MAILIASKISTVSITDAQIGACHKVFGPDNKAFYMVESATDPDTEYKVTWSKDKGFQCQCKASKQGLLCWHIRASIACAKEEREAVAELNRAIAEQALHAQVKAAMSDAETVKAAEIAKEAPVQVKRNRATAPYAPKAFSILR